MESDGGVFEAMVAEVVLDADCDIALDIELVLVGEGVDFVDEDFDVDGGVGALEGEDCGGEAGEGFEVLVLSVDDPDQGTDLTEDGVHVEVGVFEDVDLAGEVPDLEVHEGAGGRKI